MPTARKRTGHKHQYQRQKFASYASYKHEANKKRKQERHQNRHPNDNLNVKQK